MIIGAQLFTLRDYCKTLEDFSETLKKVADIGYTTVQVSGTCAYEAQWLRDQLKAAGLTCGITHYNYNRIINETEAVIEEHKTFGCRYIGVGSCPAVRQATTSSAQKHRFPHRKSTMQVCSSCITTTLLNMKTSAKTADR